PTEAEWLTRKSRIDTRLKQKGWKLIPFSPELDLNVLDKTAVEELPTANGPADYGLFVGGRLLGEEFPAFRFAVTLSICYTGSASYLQRENLPGPIQDSNDLVIL